MFKIYLFLLIFSLPLCAKTLEEACIILGLRSISTLQGIPEENLKALAHKIIHSEKLDPLDPLKEPPEIMLRNAFRFLIYTDMTGGDKAILWREMANIIESHTAGSWTSKEKTPVADGAFIFLGNSTPVQVLVINSQGLLYRGEGPKAFGYFKNSYVPHYNNLRWLNPKPL